MKKFLIDKNTNKVLWKVGQLDYNSSGKGDKLIITYIGSENGFLDRGLLEFKSKSTKDYHEEKTTDAFEEYFQQMVECVPVESVIVLDNASYHSRLLERLAINL